MLRTSNTLRALAVTALLSTLQGCVYTAERAVAAQQTAERIEYLVSPSGIQYLREQVDFWSTGGRIESVRW